MYTHLIPLMAWWHSTESSWGFSTLQQWGTLIKQPRQCKIPTTNWLSNWLYVRVFCFILPCRFFAFSPHTQGQQRGSLKRPCEEVHTKAVESDSAIVILVCVMFTPMDSCLTSFFSDTMPGKLEWWKKSCSPQLSTTSFSVLHILTNYLQTWWMYSKRNISCPRVYNNKKLRWNTTFAWLLTLTLLGMESSLEMVLGRGMANGCVPWGWMERADVAAQTR